jgi:rubrerythrin
MAPEPPDAHRALFALLRRAHAGELAAFLAYEGHWRSLRDAVEAEEVRAIAREELAHREGLRLMLERFGQAPGPMRERVFRILGTGIGWLCSFSGWFAPMYGAGFLEKGNIEEYERASELALAAGHEDLVEPLRTMARVEGEHERYFRSKVESHWLARIVPIWPIGPGPSELKETASRAPARFEKRGLLAERASVRSRPGGVPRTAPILPVPRDRS